jgi:YD repeat-containing protein
LAQILLHILVRKYELEDEMKKIMLFTLIIMFCFSLTAYYPNTFFGDETISIVTEYESTLVFMFGTYHGETKHKFEAERFNSLEQNYKPIRKKHYYGYSWNNFIMEFHIGYEFGYDVDGNITTVNRINEDDSFVSLLYEYVYFNTNLQNVIAANDLIFYYYPQSVDVSYFDYDGIYQSNRLITYLNGVDGLTNGWVGRNYDFNSDYFAIAFFTYDDEQHITSIHYETPASKEHVVIDAELVWDDDNLLAVDYGYHLHEFNYDENGRISEIIIYDANSGDVIYVYRYNYDNYGRMTGESKEEYYSTGELARVDKYEYHYNGFITNSDSDYLSSNASLIGNFPNPFNPNTTISFSLDKEQHISLLIYNLKGQKIKTLLNSIKLNGFHTISWNGTNDNDHPVSSGMYFYQLQTESQSLTKRMLLLK